MVYSLACGKLTAKSGETFTARKKIIKDKPTQEPTEFEELVAQALFDLDAANAKLKSGRYITAAPEVDVGSGKKAAVIHVTFRLL